MAVDNVARGLAATALAQGGGGGGTTPGNAITEISVQGVPVESENGAVNLLVPTLKAFQDLVAKVTALEEILKGEGTVPMLVQAPKEE